MLYVVWRMSSIYFFFISLSLLITPYPNETRRFGIQMQLVSTDFQKIYRLGEKVFVGLPGLATDVQTVYVFILHPKEILLIRGMI